MENNHKTKIIIAITKAQWGGAQKYVYDLATGLIKQNFDVKVILGGNGTLKDKLEETKNQVFSLSSLERDVSFTADIKSAWSLYKILQSEKPDILHLNSSKMLVLGSIVGRMAGVKNIIFTGHGWAFNEERSKISKLLLKLTYRFSFLFVNKVVFVSEQTKKQAEENGLKLSPGKSAVIYNGLAPYNLYESNEARKMILAKLSETDNSLFAMENQPVWLGTIAELHTSKGLTYAISAMTSLPKNVHYFIIGAGEEKHELELFTEGLDLTNRVHLTGVINEAGQLLKAFDFFVLPSITEALPYAILEAGLAKLPVVASRVGGIPEIITDNFSGILVNARKSQELAEAIKRYLTDKEKSLNFGHNLFETVTNKFSLEKMINSTVIIYNEML